ncbi:N-acetylneuraminate 7-O(or 9-O)-acetyltransferase [Aureococcus anophagefferens]|nr:N-acetylneuraminate 7-O(or 9-O)-acetyltransferase [Aureococcus anophagefferens]
MAGQKLLLALLVASLISYAIAAALKPPHAGNGGGDYRTFQAAGHANSSGAGTKGGASALEDELSNSALQVLRQMEDIEVRSGPAQLASVAEEDEERGEEALGKGKNPDLWAFIMALLFLVSLLNVEVLEEGTEVFLSRAQANEWKGWMQVAFVAYRRGVRRCAGASAAGRRGTPWIEYYFVALATVHFVLIWVSLAIARVIGTLVGWEKPDKKEHREACYAEKALGCALMIGLCCIIWLDPHNDGKGVYDVLLRPWLLDIDGEH